MTADIIPFPVRLPPEPCGLPKVRADFAEDGSCTVSITPCPPDWSDPEKTIADAGEALRYADMLARKYARYSVSEVSSVLNVTYTGWDPRARTLDNGSGAS